MQLPEVGKIYVSQTEPDCRFYVEAVHVIEADEDTDAGFMVEGCDPADIGNPSGDGLECDEEEWTELHFSLESGQQQEHTKPVQPAS